MFGAEDLFSHIFGGGGGGLFGGLFGEGGFRGGARRRMKGEDTLYPLKFVNRLLDDHACSLQSCFSGYH